MSDIGPEAGVVFANIGKGFLFHSDQEILANSGRAGLYKSTNRGQSWIRTEPGLVDIRGVEPYVNGLCQGDSTSAVAYALTLQNEVARTDDFGESWGPLTPLRDLSDCAVDTSDSLVVYIVTSPLDVTQPSRLFKSTDGGSSFSIVGAGLPHTFFGVAVPRTSPQTVYVGASQEGLFVSLDGGLNFDRLPNAPVPTGALYPHPTQDGTLLVSASGILFRSTDGGATFEQVGAGLPRAGTLAIDPVSPLVVYSALGADGLFRSLDGALSFARVGGLGESELRGLGVTKVGVSPEVVEGHSVVFVGTSLGPLRSADEGETFEPIHNGYRGTQVNDLAIDAGGRLLVATINSVGVFRSTYSGDFEGITDTLPRNTVTSLAAIAAASSDPQTYVIASYANTPEGGLFWTTDGGTSWTRSIVPGDPGFGSLHIAFAPSDARRVYVAATSFPGLYRSDDGGRSFERLSFMFLSSIAVDALNPDVLYVGSGRGALGLFKSIDGGRTLRTLTAGDFSAIALDSQRAEIIYAVRLPGVPLRSTDAGATFMPITAGLRGDRVLGFAADPIRSNRLFAWMSAGGLFRSDDGGDSWAVVDSGETLRRSTAQAGTTALVIDPNDPERVFLGNGSVMQVEIP